jgi:hypothetical protein
VKPLLVGENNPYRGAPYYALWPDPQGCAGWRLCHLVMGLDHRTYLNVFDRVNLLQQPKWSAPAARTAAADLLEGYGARTYVLLGAKVCAAFGVDYGGAPKRVEQISVVVLPHPSGLCRFWGKPRAFARARDVLREALPEIEFPDPQALVNVLREA